jgi:hypothetical protein
MRPCLLAIALCPIHTAAYANPQVGQRIWRALVSYVQ